MLDFIKKFADIEIDFVKQDNKYYLNNGIKTNILPFMPGLFLGEEIEGKFCPSLALLGILAKTSKEKIFVKDIGEIDFIFGKNLRKRHIERIEGTDKVGFLKLIQNQNDENLGLGKLKENLHVKNILDLGDFLRREKDL